MRLLSCKLFRIKAPAKYSSVAQLVERRALQRQESGLDSQDDPIVKHVRMPD